MSHSVEHRKSQPHRHSPRPVTTLTATQFSANRRAHNVEHQRSPHHQHRQRPPGQPTLRSADTTTTSNTRMTHAIDTGHGHTQATRRPPNSQPRDCGERHSGEAGGVTPGRGRGNNPTHNPRHRAPTRANTHAHTLDHPQVNDLDHNQPPHNQPQHCGVEHSGEAGGVTPGRGRGTGRGNVPKDVDMTPTWGMYADTSPNSTTYTNVRSRPRKYAHHHPQPV